jgi:hypothetical protein
MVELQTIITRQNRVRLRPPVDKYLAWIICMRFIRLKICFQVNVQLQLEDLNVTPY